MNADLVLSTINAPYRQQLSTAELVACLLDPTAAKATPGHMSAFFGEVDPALQAQFADSFGITRDQLRAAARAFAAYSGESYAFAA